MKRLFVFAMFAVLAAIATTPAVLAQDLFGWDSHIVIRTGSTTTPQGTFRVDTNRFDMTIPLLIPGATSSDPDLVIRGAGQVLAPRYFWAFYDPYYNGETPEPNDRDQTYVDQFKGVQQWALDSVRVTVFHNSDNVSPQFFGQIDFWKLNTDYSDARVGTNGVSYSRQALEPKRLDEAQYIIDADALVNTVDQNGAIQPTTVSFDPPLEFTKDESLMMMYINDFAAPVEQPIGQTGDTREWQRMIGYMEFQSGDGSDAAPFANPIPNNMVHGMILREEDGKDTITNTFRAISVGANPYLTNFNVIWFGVVQLDANDLPQVSSVEYHLGYDAKEQGLGEVTPNPVRDNAAIPFSLTEVANVTLELYTADGTKVETLMENKKYVEGKYTVNIKADDLESGSYLVRMTANDKAYSMKFVVTK